MANPLGDQTTDVTYSGNARSREDEAGFQKLLDDMRARGNAPPPEPEVPVAPPTPPPSFMSRVGNVAADIGTGVFKESVPQIVGGTFDAWRNAGHAVVELGDWLDKNAPEWLVGTPESQAEDKAKRDSLAKAIAINQGRDPNDPKQMEFSSANVLGVGADAKSVTGGIIRGGAQFMAGYRPAAAALKGLGMTGQIAGKAAPAIAGAVSMFFGNDPTKPNLTNLIEEKFPSLKGVITDVLATGADDNAAVNRLRNGVEGLVTGVAAEAIVRGVVATAKISKEFYKGLSRHVPTEVPGASPEADIALRDATDFVDKARGGVSETAPPFTVSVKGEDALSGATAQAGAEAIPTPPVPPIAAAPPVPPGGVPAAAAAKLADVAADVGPSVPGQVTGKAIGETVRRVAKAATLEDLQVTPNWENIDKGNLKGVIGELGSEIKDRISVAKRGEITLEGQQKLADQLGMTTEDLLARQIGQVYKPEEIIAAGKLLDASDARLLDLARIAEMPMSTAADAFRVNEQMVTHMALLENFLGSAAEAGRALGALRSVHQSGMIARAQAMHSFMEATGGQEGARNLSSMIISLKAAGKPPGALNAALGRSWGSGRGTATRRPTRSASCGGPPHRCATSSATSPMRCGNRSTARLRKNTRSRWAPRSEKASSAARPGPTCAGNCPRSRRRSARRGRRQKPANASSCRCRPGPRPKLTSPQAPPR